MGGAPGDPVLDVVVPVYNEERDLERCVRRLRAHLAAHFPYAYRITIADNASTDRTGVIADRLASAIDEVHAVRLDLKGRGRALRSTWLGSPAPVLAYMDVDLSTDLSALLPLVAPLISGHSDIAIGTRLARGARVVRGPRRELISRAYNLILRGTLAVRFSDAQCGFKAIRADVAARLLPMVRDHGWFFDTELLVIAERAGLRIHEVPVDWTDDPASTVDVVATAVTDLKGIARVGVALATGRLRPGELRRADMPGVPRGLARQLAGFCVVGVLSTAFYLGVYLGLRVLLPALAANFVALLLSAVANTALNRRITFGVRGRTGAARHQAQGLAVFLIGLALTTATLTVLDLAVPGAGHAVQVAALVAANLAATLVRFLLFRSWIFAPERKTT
ncbi:glycosyl transferase [Phytomonospora endophytica]|nr:glycosyl transferase [Phytomonospora endophytica]